MQDTFEDFSGFLTIQELMNNNDLIPSTKGVYMVLRNTTEAPCFLKIGTGGFFKEKDPNVSIEELQKNWIEDSPIMYIGKAGGKKSNATLKSRLKQYLDFGQKKKVGHKGGRYIWQLADAYSLVICWKELTEEEPREVEKKMIQAFKDEHDGQRPFANLQD